jgi:hypothetical protein
VDHDVDLPRVVVIDGEKHGAFQWYRPGKIGEMVLLDPQGEVAAVGEEALSRLREEVDALRAAVDAATARLEAAVSDAEIGTALAALLDLGLDKANAAAERYVATCPLARAGAALEAMAARGRPDVVVAALRHDDAKRRRLAVDLAMRHPAPEFATALLEIAAAPKVPGADLCLVLRAAHASDPANPDLERRLLELGRKADTSVRVCALELCGRLGTAPAKEQLLAVLAKDASKSARVAAAGALASVPGDDVAEALRRAAEGDKVDAVRAAARKALEARAK